MPTCPEMWLCCWNVHNPWETHCRLGSSYHTSVDWTPRKDPEREWCFQLSLNTRINKEFTRNSSNTLLMLLVRAFPRIPPISTFSSFRNWRKHFQHSILYFQNILLWTLKTREWNTNWYKSTWTAVLKNSTIVLSRFRKESNRWKTIFSFGDMNNVYSKMNNEHLTITCKTHSM